MGVFEGLLGAAMSEQPGGGEGGFAHPQGEAGMGTAAIVKTYVGELCLGADLVPEPVKPNAAARSSFPRRREDAAARSPDRTK